MHDDAETEYLKELFDAYIGLISQEFHGQSSFEDAYHESVSIAETLMELGFQILVHSVTRIDTINHCNDTQQTVIIYRFDIALFKHEVPIMQPLFRTCVETKIFGPRTIPVTESASASISAQDEEWLRSSLSFLSTDKQKPQPSPEKD